MKPGDLLVLSQDEFVWSHDFKTIVKRAKPSSVIGVIASTNAMTNAMFNRSAHAARGPQRIIMVLADGCLGWLIDDTIYVRRRLVVECLSTLGDMP